MEALEKFRFNAAGVRSASGPAKKASSRSGPIAARSLSLYGNEHKKHSEAGLIKRGSGEQELEAQSAANVDAREADAFCATASAEILHQESNGGQHLGAKHSSTPPSKPAKRAFISSKPPDRWKEVLDKVREMRAARDAPVDLFGTRQCIDVEADIETQRFQALVAAMISSQTKDPVTAAAMTRLRSLPGGLTIANIASSDMPVETLQSTLHPVGFFRQKGAHLKAMAQKLTAEPHNGRVPCHVKDLMELPGVGPKVAHLTLLVAFDRAEDGLIVDTHVRRVCERLGWASPERTPEQTRLEIEAWLPKNKWAETSLLLVGFGQQVCTPLRPKCTDCSANGLCPSAFKETGKRSVAETKMASKGSKSRVPIKRTKDVLLDKPLDTSEPISPG